MSLLIAALVLPIKPWARVLASGDTIEIACPEATAYCVTRTLTADGDLLLPGVLPIELTSLTPQQASMRIAAALEEAGAVPDAHISIGIVPGARRQVTISGAVNSPMTTILTAGMALPDLLLSAGAKPDADLRHIRIEAIDGEVTIADVAARSWALHAGDRVEVPITKPVEEVLVLGGVERPGILTLEDGGMTASEAVNLAGGVSGFGTTRGWRVIDAGEHSETLPDVHAASMRRLRPGDSVFVPYQATPNYVVVLGAVAQPTCVPVEGKLHLRDALKAAGGAASNADLHQVLIRHGFGKPMVVVDLAAPATGRNSDLVLDAGDSVIVPRLRVKARP